jgi:hypothetical protein
MNTRAVTALTSIIGALVLGLAWQQTTEAGVSGENEDANCRPASSPT